jgi:hypothetical protein
MYSNLTKFNLAVYNFGKKVEMICAMELSGKISSENAYKHIQQELKKLKKVRKEYK